MCWHVLLSTEPVVAGPTLDHAFPGPGSLQSNPEQLKERGIQVQCTWAHKHWGDHELAINYLQATVSAWLE
ncbi:hypothetical protein P691DRAFT_769285 [Macrolepiota fuliginosa MF-IS2]|uniref:Uncharacterized protein n=1 Tax=Macrolepiota fuliginosa MF-IS2 TaxID=1400762 RepID=A0A9P5WXC8_9AGAR|nr:hypothetical protein P691DRAFT_769285 [Macrolepiota fuliginosa MF-IS2]